MTKSNIEFSKIQIYLYSKKYKAPKTLMGLKLIKGKFPIKNLLINEQIHFVRVNGVTLQYCLVNADNGNRVSGLFPIDNEKFSGSKSAFSFDLIKGSQRCKYFLIFYKDKVKCLFYKNMSKKKAKEIDISEVFGDVQDAA